MAMVSRLSSLGMGDAGRSHNSGTSLNALYGVFLQPAGPVRIGASISDGDIPSVGRQWTCTVVRQWPWPSSQMISWLQQRSAWHYSPH